MTYKIRILEKPEEFKYIENLQRIIWPGSETEIVPSHMLTAAVHNGGLVIGAFVDELALPEMKSPEINLVGFVFGIPGHYLTADGPRVKHHSHMLGVHPNHRNQGLGFLLKRAQWQMVRRYGIDRITWTFDPLLSVNAQLNISKLGAVCNTYYENYYGELNDELNAGLITDRFQVDWWVNSKRVNRRLSNRARAQLELSHFTNADTLLLNPSRIENDIICPYAGDIKFPAEKNAIIMIEIPDNFQTLRRSDPAIALRWRLQCRNLFQQAFATGYVVTDFIQEKFEKLIEIRLRRCFYILSHGESTL